MTNNVTYESSIVDKYTAIKFPQRHGNHPQYYNLIGNSIPSFKYARRVSI